MYQGTLEFSEECCLEERCFANKSVEFMEWKTKLRVHSEQKQKNVQLTSSKSSGARAPGKVGMQNFYHAKSDALLLVRA
jgi:hypothetical protein